MIARAIRRWWKIARRSSRRAAKLRDLRDRPFRRMLRAGPPPEAFALMRAQQRLLDEQMAALRAERAIGQSDS